VLGCRAPCISCIKPHAPYENEFTASAGDHDGFADAYSAENESGLFNAYYELPAMLRLVGDVSGLRSDSLRDWK
jgi:hypothetical protein